MSYRLHERSEGFRMRIREAKQIRNGHSHSFRETARLLNAD
jgi:hypothetical protein